MPAWTPELVETAMVEAFRQALVTMAFVPIFSSRSHLLRPVIPSPGTAPTARALDVLNWPELYVTDKRRRRMLMIRISAKARRHDSIAEACREFGVVRSTFDRSCGRSLKDIAFGLTMDSEAAA